VPSMARLGVLALNADVDSRGRECEPIQLERDVERVARALQAKKRLSGDEISTLLAEAA
jgi:hypothetical protein